jgi:hypothetical protein
MTARNETVAQLPVPYAAGPARREAPRSPPRGDARFAAQLLGAGGERRGLKGGPVVLDAARAAYLETQYAGLYERRLPVGGLTRGRV